MVQCTVFGVCRNLKEGASASAKRKKPLADGSCRTSGGNTTVIGREFGFGGRGRISSHSCALSILDVLEPTRCGARICPIRVFHYSHLPLFSCITLLYSPTKASPSTRTRQVMNLTGLWHKRREPSPYFLHSESPP